MYAAGLERLRRGIRFLSGCERTSNPSGWQPGSSAQRHGATGGGVIQRLPRRCFSHSFHKAVLRLKIFGLELHCGKPHDCDLMLYR
jgi:hypothetical protein